MTGPNRRARGMFVPLQANYILDPAIQAVGNQGELAYIRSLAVAKLVDRDGVLTVHQLRQVRARIRSWDDVVGALLEHKLWVPASTVDGYRIRSWSEHNETTAQREAAKEQDAARKRAARRGPPASSVIDMSDRTPSHKRREEKREKSTDRPPSGSGRSVPAPAAPRSAGGAAQPAPGIDSAEVVASESDWSRPPGMSAAEWAKSEAEKGRRNNPAAGRQFSYRPQVPSPEPSDFRKVMDRLTEMAGESDE